MVGYKEPSTQEHSFGLPSIGIPAEVLFHPELSQTEKLLFGFIRNLSQSSRGCWASNRWLGLLVDAKNSTISSAVSKLHAEGFILVEHTPKKGSTQETERRIWIDPTYMERYRDWTIYCQDCLNHMEAPDFDSFRDRVSEKSDGGVRKTGQKEEREEERREPLKPSLCADTPSVTTTSRRTIPPIVEEVPKQRSASERALDFLPLADQLAEIVSSNKRIKIDLHQRKQWANEIRMLCEKNGINPARVKRALEWYKVNIGGQYSLVIESGAALREKFVRLEAQIERDKMPVQSGSVRKPTHSVNDKQEDWSGKGIKVRND